MNVDIIPTAVSVALSLSSFKGVVFLGIIQIFLSCIQYISVHDNKLAVPRIYSLIRFSANVVWTLLLSSLATTVLIAYIVDDYKNAIGAGLLLLFFFIAASRDWILSGKQKLLVQSRANEKKQLAHLEKMKERMQKATQEPSTSRNHHKEDIIEGEIVE